MERFKEAALRKWYRVRTREITADLLEFCNAVSLCENRGSWQCGLSAREISMSRFIEGADRAQASFLPACLEDFVDEDNPARAIDAFVEALDLDALGFQSKPANTGRSGYHPAMLLRLYIYGYRAP
jgi:hypothetical protein